MNDLGRTRGLSLVVVLVALVGISAGCSKKLPQEVSDLNRAMGQAKDACAGVYAKGDLDAIQSDVNSLNSLVDDQKYRKARKQAIPLLPKIKSLQSTAESARDAARTKAEAAISAAEGKLSSMMSAEASKYAASEQRAATAKMDEARAALNDPCRYNDAARLAAEAGSAADGARTAAIAGKRRAEEEAARKKAEEERRRLAAEEEARRRAEEERMRMFPTSYTVQAGDSLWKIAGLDKIYKNSTAWVVVYDANREEISNPDLIYPGQELKILRDMSEAEMTDAMRRLWREMAQ